MEKYLPYLEDEENKIIRIDVTAENWEENKLLAKDMGIEIDKPKYVKCVKLI